MVNWKYDLFLYSVGNIVDMFFREVVPRGAWRVPQTGPVLFVAAPHANQVSPIPQLAPAFTCHAMSHQDPLFTCTLTSIPHPPVRRCSHPPTHAP